MTAKAKFHFINHACFIVEKNNSAIIFDPYLEGNPEGLTAKDIKVDYIFVSHGHFDHLGSAFEIAKNCDATIISTAEICGLAQEAGCSTRLLRHQAILCRRHRSLQRYAAAA